MTLISSLCLFHGTEAYDVVFTIISYLIYGLIVERLTVGFADPRSRHIFDRIQSVKLKVTLSQYQQLSRGQRSRQDVTDNHEDSEEQQLSNVDIVTESEFKSDGKSKSPKGNFKMMKSKKATNRVSNQKSSKKEAVAVESSNSSSSSATCQGNDNVNIDVTKRLIKVPSDDQNHDSISKTLLSDSDSYESNLNYDNNHKFNGKSMQSVSSNQYQKPDTILSDVTETAEADSNSSDPQSMSYQQPTQSVHPGYAVLHDSLQDEVHMIWPRDYLYDLLGPLTIRLIPNNYVRGKIPDITLFTIIFLVLNTAYRCQNQNGVNTESDSNTNSNGNLLFMWQIIQRFMNIHIYVGTFRAITICSTLTGIASPRMYVELDNIRRRNRLSQTQQDQQQYHNLRLDSDTIPGGATGGQFDLMFSGHTAVGTILLILLSRMVGAFSNKSDTVTNYDSNTTVTVTTDSEQTVTPTTIPNNNYLTVTTDSDSSNTKSYSESTIIFLFIWNSIVQVAMGDHWTADVWIAHFIAVPIAWVMSKDIEVGGGFREGVEI